MKEAEAVYYTVKVKTVTTVTVEADSEDEAMERAGEIYWQYDPEQCDMEIEEAKENDER